jgi:hypothetical protein
MSFAVRKKLVNGVMFGLTGLCAAMTVGVLLAILGFLIWHGAASLSWAFFTHLPAPVGESGGGMANAIVGSGKVLLLAACTGLPIGFLGGVYLSEFASQSSAFVVRYTADLLNGVPSIVIGIVVYALVVKRMHHFSTLAGGLALGVMMIPIAMKYRGVPARSPECPSRGWPRARSTPLASDRGGGDPSGAQRNRLWRHAQPRSRRRRDRTSPLHEPQQPVLEPGPRPADRGAAGDDLRVRDRPL